MNTKTLYQADEKSSNSTPNSDSIEFVASKKGIDVHIPWQEICRLIKPIGLILSHLVTAGLTWVTTIQQLPPPIQTPVITRTQSIADRTL